ncbi:MAG: class I SAM-dependent methyltransferase [Bacteroidetes bacterium]|nr:MAG: class I SAM-dependent methyltransferase [Bacteroidota bacterium]
MIPFIETGVGEIKFPQENGVFLTRSQPLLPDFVEAYRQERIKSHRNYSHAQVKELPNAFAYNVHLREWDMRANSLKRFLKYLKRKKEPLLILDVGCGNGWFADKLARNQQYELFGLDVFMDELQQAAAVFHQPNLHFFYGDIFDQIFPQQSFDMIILNDSISYFEDLYKLLYTCLDLLKMGGEIHILDSPVYKSSELEAARERSQKYFEDLGVKNMLPFFHHHSTDDFLAFPHTYLYKPGGLKSLFGHSGGSWPWIRIVKDEYV